MYLYIVLLLQTPGGSTSQSELEECIEVILQVIKAVNDSLQQGNIRGLPEILYPLGGLVCQEVFSVHIENKQQSSHIFKSRKQTRQVLLFDTQLVFCKVLLSNNLNFSNAANFPTFNCNKWYGFGITISGYWIADPIMICKLQNYSNYWYFLFSNQMKKEGQSIISSSV